LIAQKFASLGGSQVSLVHHLQHLDRTRFAPSVAVSNTGWLTAKLDELRVPWTIFEFGQWNLAALPRNVALVLRLRRHLRENKIDLVHANEHWVGPPCNWAARMQGIPSICHFRTGLQDATAHRVRKYRYARFDKVIAVADVLGRALARHMPDPGRIVVVRDGVEPALSPPRYWQKRSRRIAVNVGAIRREKGQDKVISRALPWLKASARHFLVFVGTKGHDASYLGQIEELVKRNGLKRQVLFLGNRDDVPRLLGIADVLIAYSDIEGVPRAVTEAMQAGRPVLVSNTPGMAEVVTEGEVGRILDFEDPMALSRALFDLSADVRPWVAMGQRAHERAGRYSTRAMCDQIQGIYNEALEGKAKQ